MMATLLFTWQESHTVNTAAFWSWSVSSSGFSPSRSSRQSTMAAGLAGRLWRSASMSGSWKLKLHCNKLCSQLDSKSPLLLLGYKSKTNRFSILYDHGEQIYLNITHCFTFSEVASDCWAHNTSIPMQSEGLWWSRWTWSAFTSIIKVWIKTTLKAILCKHDLRSYTHCLQLDLVFCSMVF